MASLAIMFPAGFGTAEARSVKVKAGQRDLVWALYITDETCLYGGRPRVAIRVPPVNGKAEIALVPWKIPAGRNCQGQTIKVTVVYYTPKRGFRGRDSVTLDVTMDMYTNEIGERSLNETIDITVE